MAKNVLCLGLTFNVPNMGFTLIEAICPIHCIITFVTRCNVHIWGSFLVCGQFSRKLHRITFPPLILMPKTLPVQLIRFPNLHTVNQKSKLPANGERSGTWLVNNLSEVAMSCTSLPILSLPLTHVINSSPEAWPLLTPPGGPISHPMHYHPL